jgi:hypothetical protein
MYSMWPKQKQVSKEKVRVMKYLNVMAVVIVMFMSVNLLAVVEEVTFDAIEDAYVDKVDTGLTFNSETLQIQGFSGTSLSGVESVQRSFLKFAVVGLEEKTILSVRFRAHLNTWSNVPIPPAIQLSYVGDDSWTQGNSSPTNNNGINWINQPSDTTLIGGLGEAIDIPRYYEWLLYQKDSPIDVYWYDDHLASDGFASYMLTVGNEDLTSYAYFSSDEGANRPELIIEYIPEPATLVLLGLGTMLIRKRRGRSSL